MHLVGIATFSAFVETSFNRITCEFSGACCVPGPTTTGVGVIVRPGPRYRRAIPMCLGAIVGVFVHRYETDSTFASTSLQRNETVIAFASDERPFLGHFDPAKVLVVSMGRAAWPAKVLPVSNLPRHRVLCAKKFALLVIFSVSARQNSPCRAKIPKNGPMSGSRASFVSEVLLRGVCWANFVPVRSPRKHAGRVLPRRRC